MFFHSRREKQALFFDNFFFFVTFLPLENSKEMSINIHLLVIIFVIQKQKVYILSVWQGVFNLFVPRPEDTILNTNVTVFSAKFVEC